MSEETSLIEILREAKRNGTPIDWDSFLARHSSHPDEAARQIRFSSLGWILPSRPPAAVVRALLNAHRDVIFKTQFKLFRGRTPVGQACYRGASGEVIRMILDANPSDASQGMRSRRHILCIPLVDYLQHCRCDQETVRAILDANPQGIKTREGSGQFLPLHIAAGGVDRVIRGEFKSIPRRPPNVAPPDVLRLLIERGRQLNAGGAKSEGGLLTQNRYGRTPLGDLCDVMQLTRVGHGSQGNWTPVNVVVLIPFNIVEMCGHLWDTLSLLVRETHSAVFGDEHETHVLHAAIELECPPAVLRYVLRNAPQHAGVRDGRGRMPLHLAAEGGMGFDGVLDVILREEPRALVTTCTSRDSTGGMYPFQLAAIGDDADVDAVYRLLLENPHVVKPYCSAGSSKKRKRSHS